MFIIVVSVATLRPPPAAYQGTFMFIIVVSVATLRPVAFAAKRKAARWPGGWWLDTQATVTPGFQVEVL